MKARVHTHLALRETREKLAQQLLASRISETKNPVGAEFGSERFRQFLEAQKNGSANQCLLEELARWSGRGEGEDLDDDITMVTAKHMVRNRGGGEGAIPDLSAFKDRGGKLIIYHGWSDQAVTPLETVRYYQSVSQQQGSVNSTPQFARLFMRRHAALHWQRFRAEPLRSAFFAHQLGRKRKGTGSDNLGTLSRQ